MAGKVLVIDFDGQANSSRFFAEPKAELETALIKKSFSPTVARSSTRYPIIDIVTATSALNLIAAQFEQLSDEAQTANVRKIMNFDDSYEYAVLDSPLALTMLTEKVITLSDSVFVPIELGTFAIQGIPTVTNALANCNAKFGGCIVNKFDKENPSDIELLELLKHTLGNKELNTTITFSRVIKNSFSYKLTAKKYMKWTAVSMSLSAVTGRENDISDLFGGRRNVGSFMIDFTMFQGNSVLLIESAYSLYTNIWQSIPLAKAEGTAKDLNKLLKGSENAYCRFVANAIWNMFRRNKHLVASKLIDFKPLETCERYADEFKEHYKSLLSLNEKKQLVKNREAITIS